MERRQNILLITIDSLRADYLYGDETSTPVHDRLASEGVHFDNAFAQGPFTTFSMPSLFTSRYPSALQYVEFSDSTVGVYIDDEPTLQSELDVAGYDTAGFHSNPLLSNLFGFNRGFDTFDARLPLSDTDLFGGRTKILADKILRLFRKHAYLPAKSLTKRALNWLDNRDDSNDPFFIWLHFMDVHGPYQAKDGIGYLNKYRGERLWRKALKQPDAITDAEHKRLIDLYCEEIEYTDEAIGEFIDAVDNRGLLKNTTTVLTADHGELFNEYGKYSHPHELHDQLLRVPLIIHGQETDADRVTDIVELVDIAPTLLEVANKDVPEEFVGTNLFADRPQEFAIGEADLVPSYHGSVRTSEYKYVRNDIRGTEALYRVEEGIETDVDIADAEPVEYDRLQAILREHLGDSHRDVGSNRGIAHKDINNADVENRLEDLGYL